MATTKLNRIAIGFASAGIMAATVIGGAGAASATTTSHTDNTASASYTASPANPSSTSKATQSSTSTKTTSATKSKQAANSMIHGINLTVKNTTKDKIAITFNYQGSAGGQATWTWLNPGESTSTYNATSSGPDVYNSYVYFPSTGKQLKFESKLAGWSGDTTITFDGTEYTLDRGQSATGNKQGHAFTVSRGSNDIQLPETEWVDGLPTVTPDMVLNFTL